MSQTPRQHFRKNADRVLRIIHDGYKNGLVEMTENIVDKTPVDKDEMIGNWYLLSKGESAPSFVEGQNIDPYGWDSKYRSESKAERLRRKEKEVNFVNNAPYAYKIEYGRYRVNPMSYRVTQGGFSSQAPKGILRAYESEYGKIMKDAIHYELEAF